MPYAIKNGTVIKKNTGKVVGKSKNPKKYMRVLQAVEHGWKPTKKNIAKSIVKRRKKK